MSTPESLESTQPTDPCPEPTFTWGEVHPLGSPLARQGHRLGTTSYLEQLNMARLMDAVLAGYSAGTRPQFPRTIHLEDDKESAEFLQLLKAQNRGQEQPHESD